LVPDWDSAGSGACGFRVEKIKPLRLLKLSDTLESPKSTDVFRLPRGIHNGLKLNFALSRNLPSG
jgi:hypothetical protein